MVLAVYIFCPLSVFFSVFYFLILLPNNVLYTSSQITNLSINIVPAIGTHVKHSHFGTESSWHQLIHLVARPHQLLGHAQVTSVQAMDNAQSKSARQEAS